MAMCLDAFSSSEARGPRTSSASAPAISTPVGPPPTTEIESWVSSWNLQRSSKRLITSARIFIASATLFIPRACSATPLIPKSAVADPSATMRWSNLRTSLLSSFTSLLRWSTEIGVPIRNAMLLFRSAPRIGYAT